MAKTREEPQETITVSGVTFSADQVKKAVVTIDGRDIHIGQKKDTDKTHTLGFSTAKGTG